MPRTIFFLGGASYPADRHVEDDLTRLFAGGDTEFISHVEVCRRGGDPDCVRSIDAMVAALKQAVPPAHDDAEIILIGRSAGARAITLLATERSFTALVCISYPFKNPGQVLELGRFAHLATLETPTLIVQGVNDEYGGAGLTEDYPLSPTIGLHFFEGGHDVSLTAPECAHVPEILVEFVGGGWRRPGHRRARFDEAFYLARHPDVAQAVAAGQLASGEEHFELAGRSEQRRFRLLPERVGGD